jgi:hypothetical protein
MNAEYKCIGAAIITMQQAGLQVDLAPWDSREVLSGDFGWKAATRFGRDPEEWGREMKPKWDAAPEA